MSVIYTSQPRPTSTFTKIARVLSGAIGRFNIGTFGKAKFGRTDALTRQARPSTPAYTKSTRP